MATVAQIVSRASLLTSLQDSGAEQTLMIAFVNEIYRQAVEDSECAFGELTVSVTAGNNEAALTNTSLVRAVSATIENYSGYDLLILQPVSHGKMKEHRESDETGVPRYYNMTTDGNLTIYPAPEQTCTVTVSGVIVPTTDLITSDTPTLIPARYHHSVIGSGVVALCWDREGQHDRADRFWQRYRENLLNLTDWANRTMGDRVDSFFVDHRDMIGDPSRDVR
jgi:hypothetical protein